MISFYGEKTYKCKVCGEEKTTPYNDGLCSICRYKDLVSKVNSLCATCKKKCKQTELITIAKCPEYTPKTSPDVQKGGSELTFSDSRVTHGKKKKKALKRKKRSK